jgi:hypothetical protein
MAAGMGSVRLVQGVGGVAWGYVACRAQGCLEVLAASCVGDGCTMARDAYKTAVRVGGMQLRALQIERVATGGACFEGCVLGVGRWWSWQPWCGGLLADVRGVFLVGVRPGRVSLLDMCVFEIECSFILVGVRPAGLQWSGWVGLGLRIELVLRCGKTSHRRVYMKHEARSECLRSRARHASHSHSPGDHYRTRRGED